MKLQITLKGKKENESEGKKEKDDSLDLKKLVE